jgi:glycosyltransferase involved in cell wall biosynthesis
MLPSRILELRSVVGTGGGPEKTILFGTAAADRQRFEVTVCYIRDLRDDRHDLHDRAKQLGVDYFELSERHSFDWRVWPQLIALCRLKRVELIHAHDYKTSFLGWLAARKLGIDVIATAHGWTGHSWRERRLYYPAEKWVMKRFPRVIAVSGEIRRDLIAHGTRADAVSVVLNGIDPANFRREPSRRDPVRATFGIPLDACVIGSVGRLEPQKRFDLLIEAVRLVRREHPNVYLVIAGDGGARADLEAQVEQLAASPWCRLVGHQTNIRDLHNALDLYVQSSDYEGTSNAVLEAMAMETSIVATDAGGTAEMIEDDVQGIVVARGSASELARAVARLVDDPATRKRLSQAARLRVEGPLSFAARMRAVEDICQEIIVKRRRSNA